MDETSRSWERVRVAFPAGTVMDSRAGAWEIVVLEHSREARDPKERGVSPTLDVSAGAGVCTGEAEG